MNPVRETIGVTAEGALATVELRRPPHNYFDLDLIRALAGILKELDADSRIRAVVLAAEGRSFCAGADFGVSDGVVDPCAPRTLYREAVRLFRTRKPIVAALHGHVVGGGLGLALVADFRVVTPSARLSANFVRLGLHPGFGLTTTLPRLVGAQRAAELLLGGGRIGGEEAVAIGLADRLAQEDELRAAAVGWAAQLAEAAPLALQDARATLWVGLAEAVEVAVGREALAQARHLATQDFREGVAATAQRRAPVFVGQ